MPSSALEVGFPCLRISSTDSDTSKHSFVEMYQAFPQLRKHLRGQAMVHTNIHFVNANTSFFMYVQFAFLHILMERTRMQSTGGMKEPETLASGQRQIFRRVPSGMRGKKSACNLDLHEMLIYRLCLLVNNRKVGTWVSAGCSKSEQ